MTDTPDAAADGRPTVTRSILINVVLDSSGSMESIRDATIEGFNEFKRDQCKEDGNALFTLTLFNTRMRTVCESVPVREVPDLDFDLYEPHGSTALYDAIGLTMAATDEFVAAYQPDQVLFVILTDGLENASRQFDRERVFSLIEDRRRYAGYEFVYLGANQDSYAIGTQIGVAEGHMLDFVADSFGAASTMQRLSRNVSGFRRRGLASEVAWFDGEVERVGSIDPDAWRAQDLWYDSGTGT